MNKLFRRCSSFAVLVSLFATGLPVYPGLAAEQPGRGRPPHIPVNTRPVGGPPDGVFKGSNGRSDEIVALRTRTSRTFQTDFGAMETEVFAGPIHFQANDGWRPIDNTLEARGAGFANRANEYRLQLPKVLGAAPVRFELGNDFVALDLEGATGQAHTNGNAATYQDALAGVDVRYEALSDSVKEELVLESAQSTSAFTWRMSTSPSLTPETTLDGGVAFVSDDGSIPMAIPAPVIFDAAGPVDGASPPHRFELVRGEGWDELRLVVDEQWLAAPERSFPVTVDPTVDATGIASRDCYISDAQPNTSFCGGSQLYAGKYSGTTLRALLRFDVSAIPSNAEVLNGTLGLYHETATAVAQNDVAVRPLTRNFVNHEATWNQALFLTPWANPGGDFDNTQGFVRNGDTWDRAEWKYWYITRLARDWVAKGASANNGVIVKAVTENVDQRLSFSSMESGNNPAPRLTILWDSGGMGSLSTYQTEDKKLAEGRHEKVNVATGNLHVRETDFTVKGTGLDLVMERHYNSLVQHEKMPTASQLGTGWTLSSSGDIGLKLFWDETSGAPGKTGAPTGTPARHAVFFGPSGYRVPFVKEETTGVFKRPPGLNADLRYSSADDRYVLTFRKTEDRYVFSSGGILLEHKDKNGNKIQLFYDNNRLTSLQDTQGRVTTFTYNSNGMLTAVKDPANRTHQYGYTEPDDPKLLTTHTDPAGFVTTYGYDSTDRLLSITDAEGHQTLYQYNANNRVTKVTYVTNKTTNPPTGDATTFDYFTTPDNTRCPAHTQVPASELRLSTVVTDARTKKTTYCYSELGRVGLIKDAENHTTHMKYDSNANITNVVDANNQMAALEYDTAGNLTQTTAPSSGTGSAAKVVKIEYDSVHSGMPSSVKDTQGNTTKYEYDSRGNLTSTTLAADTTEAVKFVYDYNATHGNLTRIRRPDASGTSLDAAQGNDILFGYDAAGNLLTIDYPPIRHWPNQYADPSQAGNVSYRYDALSRVYDMTDGHGRWTKYEWDVLDGLFKVEYSQLSNFMSTYYWRDKIGNLVKRSDNGSAGSVESTYKFDLKNQLVEETHPGESTTFYGYDAVGNLTSIAKGGATTRYAYDDVNLPIQLTDPDGLITRFDYDNTYRRTLVAYPNDTSVYTHYTNGGDVWKIEAYKNGVTDPFVKLEYLYERGAGSDRSDQGLLQKVVDHRTGHTTSYTYDKLNRLTDATRRNSTSVVDQFVYSYDPNSNLTRATRYDGTTKASEVEFTYGQYQELIRCRRVVGTTGCHSGSTNPIEYYYDASGNMQQGVPAGTTSTSQTPADVSYSYDQKSHATHVTKPNSTVSFSYVGATQSERKTKSSNGVVSSQYDALGLERDTAFGDVITYLRDNKGQAIGQKVVSGTSTARRYYVRDRLGSVVAITNGQAEVTKRYSYDPYGNMTATGTDDVYQPWRFAQGYFDQETGLYKMGERYYDPLLHRFTQTDPVMGSLGNPIALNPYLYAGNNPVNFVDPTGRFWDEVKAAAAAGLVSAAVMAIPGVGPTVVGAAGGCAYEGVLTYLEEGDGTAAFMACLKGAALGAIAGTVASLANAFRKAMSAL